VSAPVTDRFEAARTVADAVLYEGYVLYPYRASSRKNQARFQWGVLTPRAFSQAEGSERWAMRTECLVAPGVSPALSVRVRCLHSQRRRIEKVLGSGFEVVESLEVDGTLHVAWDEAIDEIVDVPPFPLPLDGQSERVQTFSFAGGTESEEVRAGDDTVVGRFVRLREPICGLVRIATSRPDPESSYVKVAVTVENTTAWGRGGAHRDDAMPLSLISVHTMLGVDDGRFVSLLDPPGDAARAAHACHSDGAYPVLIGDDDVALSSPIILYDHPEVAPQSPGDLYDSLEIDEILALRVMTLTDGEKSEARGTDPRAAAIIDRCDDMSAETLGALHGQMTPVRSSTGPSTGFDGFEGLEELEELEELEGSVALAGPDVPWWDPEVDASFDPWTESVWIAGVEVTKGTAVRLAPSHRADAQDIFLSGLAATVAGVFTDVDGDQHVAVTVDDDPATEELTWQGRYLFFHVDEVEPLVDQGEGR
jgi:hypothetical protein